MIVASTPFPTGDVDTPQRPLTEFRPPVGVRNVPAVFYLRPDLLRTTMTTDAATDRRRGPADCGPFTHGQVRGADDASEPHTRQEGRQHD